MDQEDALVIQIVTQIAKKHDVLVDVDVDNHEVRFRTDSAEKHKAIAEDLKAFFHE